MWGSALTREANCLASEKRERENYNAKIHAHHCRLSLDCRDVGAIRRGRSAPSRQGRSRGCDPTADPQRRCLRGLARSDGAVRRVVPLFGRLLGACRALNAELALTKESRSRICDRLFVLRRHCGRLILLEQKVGDADDNRNFAWTGGAGDWGLTR